MHLPLSEPARGSKPPFIAPGDLDFAGKIASLAAAKLPSCFDREDLQQIAKLELIRAAASYDPARGASFRTYAAYRIRGAVLMAARRRNWTEAHHEQLGVPHEGLLAPEAVDAILNRSRVIKAILRVADHLPNPHRFVFRRRYVDGAEARRVARQCHWTVAHLCGIEIEALAMIRSRLALYGITSQCVWM